MNKILFYQQEVHLKIQEKIKLKKYKVTEMIPTDLLEITKVAHLLMILDNNMLS